MLEKVNQLSSARAFLFSWPYRNIPQPYHINLLLLLGADLPPDSRILAHNNWWLFATKIQNKRLFVLVRKLPKMD